MNSLRSALTAASPATNGPDIRAKENIRYELTQTQKPLDIDRPSHGRANHVSRPQLPSKSDLAIMGKAIIACEMRITFTDPHNGLE
jgi:hypothetical protein